MNLHSDNANITYALACAIEDRKLSQAFWAAESLTGSDVGIGKQRSEGLAKDAEESVTVMESLMADITAGELIIVRRADIQHKAVMVARADGIDATRFDDAG